ncbi:alcohol dehydrogenase catalytic domain-containing protein [Candidatus Woesearchaeota archaeon]|nr:alcohol dehydrogenase catalytic domain-containing protein [Candidatus Woesearchaeota archaeon]
MRVRKYKVVAPETLHEEESLIEELPPGHLLLKPILTGICQSDIRYFFGRRDPEVLKKKYPLALLHEGIAVVVAGEGSFKKGDRVVAVPNIPCYIHREDKSKCDACSRGIHENYCNDVKFLSSNKDGMAQTMFVHPADCTVKVPDEVTDESAALTELLTVNYRAGVDAGVNANDKAIVMGAGPTGFLMAVSLRYLFGIRKENLFLADIKDSKLANAKSFASVVNAENEEIPLNYFDKAFECVGRRSSEIAINTSIEALKLRGVLMLLGVSEEKRAVNTRRILEKGLTIKGTTRSPRQDYSIVLDALRNPEFQKAASKIIHEQVFPMTSSDDMVRAFRRADDPEHYGKVLLSWG